MVDISMEWTFPFLLPAQYLQRPAVEHAYSTRTLNVVSAQMPLNAVEFFSFRRYNVSRTGEKKSESSLEQAIDLASRRVNINVQVSRCSGETWDGLDIGR